MKLKSSKIFHALVASLLMFSLSGCICEKEPAPEPEVHVVQKVVYVKQEIPEVSKPPKGLEYTPLLLRLNDKDYYIISLTDGEILNSNWDRFYLWSMTNYQILQNLRDNKDNKNNNLIKKD